MIGEKGGNWDLVAPIRTQTQEVSMSSSTISPNQTRIGFATTQVRATGPTPGEKAKRAFRSILGGLAVTTPFLPGPGAIAAGVGGAVGRAVDGLTNRTGATGSAGDAMQEGYNRQMELIGLQRNINSENLRFSTYSNVLKSKHDTHKTIVNNYR